MKITAVTGSPTINGNTCILAREVLRGAQDAGAEVEEIFLADHKIEFCRGCISRNAKNMCMSTGNCIIDDDVNALKQKLYKSDGIVLASPSYGVMESALMKNFLVDRIGMYTVYTSGLAGKYFVGVSTCGGIGAETVAKNLAKHYIVGFHKRGYMTGHIGAKVGYGTVATNIGIMEKAYEMGKKLVKDIEKKRKYPFQKIFNRIIIRLFARKVILNNIYSNKDGIMKAVYDNLIMRNLIKVKP
jgi:multimeric flavodoxin WrbA